MKSRTAIFAALMMCFALTGCTMVGGPQAGEQQEQILLTALFGESTSDPGISDMISERIKQAFPNVELEWESVDWGERFASRLNAKIASGETPDLIIGKAQDLQAYQATGAIGVFPQAFAGLLTQPAVQADTLDGRLYGLTYNQMYQGVLYNKNIFYRYNFKIPQTLEELYAIVDKLEASGITPFAAHFQETWYTGNIMMQLAINNVFAHTPDWGEQLRAGSVSFLTDVRYRHCVEQVLYQLAHTWKDAVDIAQSESDQRFANEEAAMYLTGSWSVQTLQSIAPYRKIGIFPYPNLTGDAKLIVEPNITFMKSATTAHDALIDDIYRMLLEDETLAQNLCAFAQTDTTLLDVTVPGSLEMIRDDLNRYLKEDRVISASAGNNQLIWEYQYACATSLLSYLNGTAKLDEVLSGWDKLRMESMLVQ